uniref:Uncharacterized protein n=1 Tax=Arundo donax TaxID=35708 RepID=A0A0A8ZAC9_ARUDO
MIDWNLWLPFGNLEIHLWQYHFLIFSLS